MLILHLVEEHLLHVYLVGKLIIIGSVSPVPLSHIFTENERVGLCITESIGVRDEWDGEGVIVQLNKSLHVGLNFNQHAVV